MTKKTQKKRSKIEPGPATEILEELFNDFNRDRKEIFKLNLIRGIFFGLGSAIGGTVIIALIVWLLSLFSNTWIGPLVNTFRDAIN